jgi:hypothetical protein
MPATHTRRKKGFATRPAPEVHSLPAGLEVLAPTAVAQASRKLFAAQTGAQAAHAAAESAREALSAAQVADHQEAVAAARDGRTVKTLTAAKAEAKADQEARSAAAHDVLVREAADEMLAQVRVHCGEMAARADAELEEVAADVTQHLDAIGTAFARTRELRFFRDALAPDGLDGRGAAFIPALRRSRERDPVPASARTLLGQIRELFAPTRKYKTPDELDADERDQVQRARGRGLRAPTFPTTAYRSWAATE